jgi:predicted secreted protein
MQTDGDLVIIDENGVTRWRSATAGEGDRAVFQNDGNLVVYDARMSSQWTSRTAGNNGAVLVLRADGDVCIVRSGGAVVWSSGTAH